MRCKRQLTSSISLNLKQILSPGLYISGHPDTRQQVESVERLALWRLFWFYHFSWNTVLSRGHGLLSSLCSVWLLSPSDMKLLCLTLSLLVWTAASARWVWGRFEVWGWDEPQGRPVSRWGPLSGGGVGGWEDGEADDAELSDGLHQRAQTCEGRAERQGTDIRQQVYLWHPEMQDQQEQVMTDKLNILEMIIIFLFLEVLHSFSVLTRTTSSIPHRNNSDLFKFRFLL